MIYLDRIKDLLHTDVIRDLSGRTGTVVLSVLSSREGEPSRYHLSWPNVLPAYLRHEEKYLDCHQKKQDIHLHLPAIRSPRRE
jgi:hypothetical protein